MKEHLFHFHWKNVCIFPWISDKFNMLVVLDENTADHQIMAISPMAVTRHFTKIQKVPPLGYA